MSLPDQIKDVLTQNGIMVKKSSPMGGGDINQACKIETDEGGSYFLKYNDLPSSFKNLQTEADSLLKLKKEDVIPVPEVILVKSLRDSNMAFLLMEYIPYYGAVPPKMAEFGERLAKLHSCSQDHFGWHSDNFIGSLPQYNNEEDQWADFYINQRLLPQIKMGMSSGAIPGDLVVDLTLLMKNIPGIVPNTSPQLVHGDLWSGNYHVGPAGEVYLIDPSCSYANGEMDLAMSMLFGGFSDSFYEAYEQQDLVEKDWRSRVPLYQLYYLLVHVNLFGSSYLPGVMRAVTRYI